MARNAGEQRMVGVILAIDPGNEKSAFCLMNAYTYKPIMHGKVENAELLKLIDTVAFHEAVIERVACYGMPVGREVFETCEWIGRFSQVLCDRCIPVSYIYRSEEKINLCHSARAKDTNIRQALIERFAEHDKKNGKGTKANPDWFYGFSADEWAAAAAAVTWLDKQKEIAE